jgi:DNA invertase Pin-like site-specific DNA recombinase
MTKAALYLRVSTNEQSTAHQRRELEAVAKARGWDVVAVFEDVGVSGAKGRDKRPGLDSMLKDATRRRFDVVAAWSLDRLGRSAGHVALTLDELRVVECGVYLHKQAFDTTTPWGKAMLTVAAAFAELERDMIRERVKSGIATARARGVRLGRPGVGARVEGRILKLRTKGHGMIRIAKEVGCGVSVVQRVVASNVR